MKLSETGRDFRSRKFGELPTEDGRWYEVSSIGSEGLRKVEIVIWGWVFMWGFSAEVSYSNRAEGAREGFGGSGTSLVETFESRIMLVIVKLPVFKGSEKKSSPSPGCEFPKCEAEVKPKDS